MSKRLQFLSNRLYKCNESTSTCIETTVNRSFSSGTFLSDGLNRVRQASNSNENFSAGQLLPKDDILRFNVAQGLQDKNRVAEGRCD